jgi:type II secretory pathway component GspD/PulD (secretin)
MKLKTLIAALFGAFLLQHPAISQTDTPTTNPPVASADTNEAASMVATNLPPVPAADSNATTTIVTTTVTSNVPAATAAGDDQPTNATAAEVAETLSIPLIQFQDVPITTAIENLARQADINYLLDPKIGYGQADQNGQIKAEPTLSIRWENITAEHALMALLDNYSLQLVEDRKTQIARITIKDPTAPPPLITRVIQLKYASVSNMEAAVSSALSDRRSRVVSDARTSQLVVVATEMEQADVDTLVNQLDKPTRQVLIETKLVEISSNPSTSKGVDWSGTLAAQNVSFGNGVLSGTSTLLTGAAGGGAETITLPGGRTVTTTESSSQSSTLNTAIGDGGVALSTASGLLPDTGFLNADGVKAVLSFLNQSADAQVVSTPRVVTLDNEMAMLSVTRAFPIFTTTAGTQGSPGGASLNYSNLGTTLEVTPRISANDYIWLRVVPEVSSFFANVSVTVNGLTSQAPEFDTRHIETQVLIPNANTLVMGGLVKDNPQASYTKVPILGDIPILGFAFRSENKSLDKDNLLIFITPTIIKDADFKPNTSDFLNSRPARMKSPMNPNTWWDSAKPRGDWSNPVPTPGEFNKNSSESE